MRTNRVLALLGGLVIAANAGTVHATDTAAEVKSLAQKLVDINALVSTVYTYSFNTPQSRELPFRVFNKNDNSFTLNDAWLSFSRQRDDENFGFVVDMDFGDTARYEASDWNGDGIIGPPDSEETNSFELREAYLTYKVPLEIMGEKPTLRAGKFVTLLGYEVLKTNTAFNPNISNSILFGYSIPFTHTGILAHVPLGDMVSADIGLVNGWDNVVDNNAGKTLLAGVGVTPSSILSMYFAGTYGAEQNGQDSGGAGAGSKRGVVTANATLKATDQLSFVVDSVYGDESNLLPDSAGLLTKSADWYGAAGYVLFDVNDKLSVNFRAEVFDDPDGVRNFSGTPATLWEFTPTVAYKLNDHVLARAEYRHDEADHQIYEKNSRMQRGSDTVTGELLVAF